MYSIKVYLSAYLVFKDAFAEKFFGWLSNNPDIRRSISLESIASPVAMEPYIYMRTIGHSISN